MNIFMHIPKTAGSSIRQLIKRNYNEDERYPIYGYENIKNRLNQVNYNSKIIYGHFKINQIDFKGAKIFTFFRKPHSLCISLYNYTKKSHPESNRIRNSSNLIDYIERYMPVSYDNPLIRYTAGVKNREKFGSINEQHLFNAKRNIESLNITVCFMEEFSKSLVLLQKENFLKKIPLLKKNVGLYKKIEDTKTIKFLDELNKYDNQLYNYAINRFNKSVHKFSLFDKGKAYINSPNKIIQKFFK